LLVAIAIGQILTDGSAEIAGVMVASLILCTRAFWSLRERSWFLPLVVGWAVLHFIAFGAFIIPMRLATSKGFIQIIWPEFFIFAGLMWLADRFWKTSPDA
jgi:hypothetical protein